MDYKINNKFPVILVHGFAGYGFSDNIDKVFPHFGYAVKDSLLTDENSQKIDGVDIYRAAPGPFSSYHDRACEVLAQIKGTVVDYGEEHAEKFGHNRYGEDYTGRGFCPDWSEDNPVHVVAYSAGGPTALLMQKMLEEDRLGWGSNSRWIKSISGIKPSWNGSPAAYFFGVNEDHKLASAGGFNLANPIGFFFANLIYVMSFVGPYIRKIYDLDFWQYNVKRKKGESLREYLIRLNYNTLGRNFDHIGYDVSLQGAYEFNKNFESPYKGTHYFSYISSETKPAFWNKKKYVPEFNMNPVLFPSAWVLGTGFYEESLEYAIQRYIPEWGTGKLKIENFRESDGVLPTQSQNYPWINPNYSHETYYRGSIIENDKKWEDGVWYSDKIQDFVGGRWDHLDLILPIQTEIIDDTSFKLSKQEKQTKLFWKQLYARIASL